MSCANLISVSGGKDSTALALLALERGAENLRFVFADTGHEHPQTYAYIQYLDGELRDRCGTGIQIVKADFASRVERKRQTVETKWRAEGIPESRIQTVLSSLYPTGVPFLDLCLIKGRFPSTRARFCSEELKHIPINQQAVVPLLGEFQAVISWQGVRADESRFRAALPERDAECGQWEPDPEGILIYRPLLQWTADDVFAMHRRHGVRHNPLYEQGMKRVGCMPCIHSRKSEIREIAKRFPEEVARVAEWEQRVSEASKRGLSSFFSFDKTPGDHVGRKDIPMPGINAVVEWSRTSRGGRNLDMFLVAEDSEIPACSSQYGLCE